MPDIEATYTRDPGGPDRWLSSGRRPHGLGPDYDRNGHGADASLDQTRAQLAADHRSNPDGAFIRLRMSLPPRWRVTLAGLEPEAAGDRLLQAAKRAVFAELPRHQGTLVIARDRLNEMPLVEVILSPRLRDGGDATFLGRSEMARLEAGWDHAVRVTLGHTRDLVPARSITPHRKPDLREQMDRAMRRFMHVLDARMRGDVGQQELRDAARDAEMAATAYRMAHARATPEPLAGLPPDSPSSERRTEPDLERDRHGVQPSQHAKAVDYFEVDLRLARGFQYLARVPLDRQSEVVHTAARSALPFLAPNRPGQISIIKEGTCLRVRVAVPADAGWTKEQLQKPIFQFRFGREIQRAFMAHGGREQLAEGLRLPARIGAVGRAVSRAARTTIDVGQAIQAPARTLAESALFSRMPSPLRTLRGISRALGFLGRQED